MSFIKKPGRRRNISGIAKTDDGELQKEKPAKSPAANAYFLLFLTQNADLTK